MSASSADPQSDCNSWVPVTLSCVLMCVRKARGKVSLDRMTNPCCTVQKSKTDLYPHQQCITSFYFRVLPEYGILQYSAFCIFKLKFPYFMCRSVLPTCISGHHVCVSCLVMPEEGIRFPRTEVIDSCKGHGDARN